MTVFLKAENNKLLRELLLEKNINISSPCGGIGKCGKCRIKLLSGKTEPMADENGFVVACHTKLLSDCAFYIPEEDSETVYFENKGFPHYAVCDIGTTNIKIRKYSSKGDALSAVSFRNPQSVYGADVISRISASKNGGYIEQSRILREGIAEKLNDVCLVYICGNPTMIHFFAGVDPSPIGVYPFEPVFKEMRVLEKSETGLNFKAVLLPSASGYVGSDAICGIYCAMETNSDNKNILIADIGTNGEISLLKNGKIYSATTAAGPAIEGAEIEMGKCGGDGVVFGITKEGKPRFKGDFPKGINGAGLISIIAFLLKNGVLSSEGRFLKNEFSCSEKNLEEKTDISFAQRTNSLEIFAENEKRPLENAHAPFISENKYYLSKDVFVSEKDISSFMVAKSAVLTAIEILLLETETDYSEIDVFVLTGGVCRDIEDINDVVASGLIPKMLKEKPVFIPDLAPLGANTAFCKNELEVLEKIASELKTVSLSENERFEDLFIMNTFFER